MPPTNDHLTAIFAADRALREHEKALLSTDPVALRKQLTDAVSEAQNLPDRQDAIVRLERLADLCSQVHGPEMVDALIAILDDEAPSVRVQAAEALVDVGFERYAEVARGIERALAAAGGAGSALQELPWVLVEIAEPSARPLIARFLKHPDVEVIASAVEALAELGDPEAVKDLLPLRDDPRPVELDDDDPDSLATLGELVTETLEELGEELGNSAQR
jgi:HEAT repeat protein